VIAHFGRGRIGCLGHSDERAVMEGALGQYRAAFASDVQFFISVYGVRSVRCQKA
jgi:hypothetical protein